MRKSKTVVTENGAAYQLSNPVAWRLVYRVLGGVLVAMGILLAVVSPIGVACAAFGAAVAFWLPKRSNLQKNSCISLALRVPVAIPLGIGTRKFTAVKRSLNALKKLPTLHIWPFCPIMRKPALLKYAVQAPIIT